MTVNPAHDRPETSHLIEDSLPPPVAPLALVAEIEAVAANAWPAAEVAELDGWRLRATAGVTRRANSVWPNALGAASGPGTTSPGTPGPGTLDPATLDARIAAVEHFYRSRDLPPTWQLCAAAQPAELDAVLAARGYRAHAPTWVQVAPLGDLLQHLPPLRLHPEFEVEVAEEFDPAWSELYCASEAVDGHAAAMRRGIIRRIEPVHGFVTLRIGNEPAAVGLGVVEARWLGVFSMATLPGRRRRGAASAILRTLAIWAQLYGATDAYLQVMQDNAVAQALYARAGFQTAYAYHYRVLR